MRSSNLKRAWAWLGLIMMTAVTWFGTYWLTVTSSSYDSFWMDQIGLNIILATVFSVSLIARINMNLLKQQHAWIYKIIQSVSRNSLMIYIFHPFVNDMLPWLIPFLSPVRMNPLFRIPLQTLLIVVVISIVMEIIQRAKTSFRSGRKLSALA